MLELFRKVEGAQLEKHKDAWERLFRTFTSLAGEITSGTELVQPAVLNLPAGGCRTIEQQVKIGAGGFEKDGDAAVLLVLTIDENMGPICEAMALIKKQGTSFTVAGASYKDNLELGITQDIINGYVGELADLFASKFRE